MPTRGAVVRRWRKRAAAHRAARAVSQSRLPRRPGPGSPLVNGMQSSSGVWQRVFHALVRDGLMQRTAARVGCVGGLEMQSRPLILGYVCEAGGLRGAVLCRAAAGKQPRTDTPAGPEAEMSLQSPWCCIQGWWGVCFVQLCGIRQPDDSAQMQAGRWRAPTWSSGRARRWGPRALQSRPSPQ